MRDLGGRRDLNSLDRRSPRPGSTLRPRPQFSEQGSNLSLRCQRPPSCQLDHPEIAHAVSCPVQELNLTLRCFRPTIVTTRASGAKAGLASRRHVSSSVFKDRERSDRSCGSAGNRTPFARVRTECLAIKASDPSQADDVPSVGLEPTQAGLKGRCPARWASTARTHAPRSGS